jgi:hypothetical protein
MNDTLFTKTLSEINLERLKSKLKMETGIDLEDLEWSVLLVSRLSAILRREFATATTDYSFFLFGFDGPSSVQLSIRRCEVLFHNSPKLSKTMERKVREFAYDHGFNVIEMND